MKFGKEFFWYWLLIVLHVLSGIGFKGITFPSVLFIDFHQEMIIVPKGPSGYREHESVLHNHSVVPVQCVTPPPYPASTARAMTLSSLLFPVLAANSLIFILQKFQLVGGELRNELFHPLLVDVILLVNPLFKHVLQSCFKRERLREIVPRGLPG